MGYVRQTAAAITIAGALCGCSLQPQDVATARSGPPLIITPEDAAAYAQRRQTVLIAIAAAAGLPGEPTNADEWRRFGIAAFGLADEQCDAYMAAIRRVNIARRQTIQEINLAGTATAAILGIAQASAEAVAITATAFGLAQATADNVASGLLYELPPSAVSDLVHRLRAAYDTAVAQSGNAAWSDRPTAFRTIRGYVELCLPVVIEARIADSVTAAKPAVQNVPGTIGEVGTPPLIGIQGASPAVTPTPATPGAQGGAPIGGGRAPTGKESAVPNPGPPPGGRIAKAEGDELALTPAQGRDLQRALCLAPDAGAVSFGPQTRAAITAFRATPIGKQKSSAGGTRPAPTGLSRDEIAFLIGQTCDASCYRNAYERYAFSSLGELSSLLNRLVKAVPGAVRPAQASRICDTDVRDLIARAQGNLDLPATGSLKPSFVDQLPPEL